MLCCRRIVRDSDVTHPRRPGRSAFKQQRLKSWQPILTARSVLPLFFAIGIVFIQIGVVLYVLSVSKEIEIDYTDCDAGGDNNGTCQDILSDSVGSRCECEIPLKIDEDWKGSVHMYYALEKFYQNHRMYVKSRDDFQLLGKLSKSVDDDCRPNAYTEDDKPIAPCGVIANSIFNDSFKLNHNGEDIKLLNTGIAFESDLRAYKNPSGNLQSALSQFARPLNWQKELYELDTENPDNNGFQNEDFRIWMRTAPLPNFKKHYRILDQDGLKAGEYTLHVAFQFPVHSFSGRKKMILATTNFFGGSNDFLVIGFFVMGCIYVGLGVILLIIHIRWYKVNEELVAVNSKTGLSRAADKSKYSLRRV